MFKKIALLLIVATLSFATSVKDFIDLKKCDQIINKHIYKICYSYNKKSLLGGWTTLDGDLVYKLNIKKRPRFYIHLYRITFNCLSELCVELQEKIKGEKIK